MTYALTVENMTEDDRKQFDRDLGLHGVAAAAPRPSSKNTDALMAAFTLPQKR